MLHLLNLLLNVQLVRARLGMTMNRTEDPSPSDGRYSMSDGFDFASCSNASVRPSVLDYCAATAKPDERTECFLVSCTGYAKQAYAFDMLVAMTSAFVVIAAVGIVGNITTIIIMVLYPKQNSSQFQTGHKSLNRSSTTQYLINLALADLLTLCVGMPFELLTMWSQYPWVLPSVVCHLKGLVSEVSSYVSVLTVLMFSVERYFAICHSLKMMRQSDPRRTMWFMLIAIWLVAIIFALPFGVEHKVGYFASWPDGSIVRESRMCSVSMAFSHGLMGRFLVMFHVSALLFFLLPLAVITVLYIRIAFAVRKSNLFQQRQQPVGIGNGEPATATTTASVHLLNSASVASTRERQRRAHRDAHNNKVLLMLAVVVVVFFVCYAPFQIQRLLFFYLPNDVLASINTYIYPISGILFYLSTALNPMVYNLMSVKYRRAFKQLMRCQRFADPSTITMLQTSQHPMAMPSTATVNGTTNQQYRQQRTSISGGSNRKESCCSEQGPATQQPYYQRRIASQYHRGTCKDRLLAKRSLEPLMKGARPTILELPSSTTCVRHRGHSVGALPDQRSTEHDAVLL